MSRSCQSATFSSAASELVRTSRARPHTCSQETGLPRQQAYEIVQRNAMRAWRERTPFRALLAADPEVTARIGPADLDACFDPTWYLRNVDAIYKRAGLS